MKKRLNFLAAFFALGFFAIGFAVAPSVHAQTDTIPPSVPTGISSSITASNQIYISWDASSDNVGVIGYYLYRNGQFIANTPGYTYYTDEPGAGSFSYSVAAYDGSGNVSVQSTPTPVLTIAADTTPPSVPTGLTAAVSSSSVVLSWTASTDDTGVIGYYISRNGVQLSTGSTISGTSYTDTGLTPGASYRYSVTAYDAAGNISGAATVTTATILDVTPPSVPTGLVLSVVSPTEIDLTWQPSTDNIQVAGYDIYRDGVNVGTSNTTSYADTGVVAQTFYSYTVDAYDEVGNTSRESNPQDATTPAPDTTPPSIPNGLIADAVSGSEVDLSWQPSTDNVGVTGYNVSRDGVQIGSTASTTYQDTDPALTTSTTYDYAVVAYDAAGNQSPQTSVGVTTPAYTALPISYSASSTATSTTTTYPTDCTSGAAYSPTTGLPCPTDTTTAPDSSTTTPTTGTTPLSSGFLFNTSLYFGLRNTNVTNLQMFLIQNNYLGSNYATGYFGSLTQGAVQQFQCARNIVCSGSPHITGWGTVGPRTRAALNAIEEGLSQ